MGESDDFHNKPSIYRHLDLQTRQIRILHLLPGAPNDPIHCTLHTASLDDDHPYEALSYVWGDPAIRQPITVDGQITQVTTNLASALRSLRHGETTRRLWADALCINQA